MSTSSTYYFIGKISDKSSGFQVQEMKLNGGVEFAVFLDGIVLKKITNQSFDDLRVEIKNVAEIIIATVVLQTVKPLSFSLDNWVEAKKTSVKNDVTGWFGLPEPQVKSLKTQRSPANTPWKKAAQLYNMLQNGNENHILALKDFKSAVMDNSFDSYFFAYRAAEDICRAVTGLDPNVESWDKMHSLLGSSKISMDPLIEACKLVRHGNINNMVVKSADRNEMLSISKEIITKELSRMFKLDLR